MDRKSQAKLQLENYLQKMGLNTHKPFHCLNPDHQDKNPSMSFDRRRHKVHCFGCGVDYDLFDLVALDYHLTEPAQIFKKTYELLGLAEPCLSHKNSHKISKKNRPEKNSVALYLAQAAKKINLTDYPQKRGLSAQTTARFGLGFDPSFKTGPGQPPWAALIIPTGPDSYTARNTDPKAEKRFRVRKVGSSPVFNASVLWEQSPIPAVVVEGEIDALCVSEVGGVAVALGSTANVQAFLNLLLARPPKRPLALALDNDEQGRGAEAKLADGLGALCGHFFKADLYGGFKDAGEALVNDPEAFSEAIGALAHFEDQAKVIERETYLGTCAARHLEGFKNALSGGVDTPAQPTGFPCLDAALDGGLYEGLYIVGGISSLGKTSLVTQLADQLAERGRDVLFFSLEMARQELMAKSLSRLTLLKAMENKGAMPGLEALTARGLTCAARYQNYQGPQLRLIGQAIEFYETFAERLFISEGVGDIGVAAIRREVEKHGRITGQAPVVVVDYLQILAPPTDRATDKQNTDKNVLELKRLSRDFKIPVIGLSSFNRANYRESVTMEAFKESGAIEYSSDVLLGLQLKGSGEKDFDAASEKNKNPRQVELVILKNRQGPAGLSLYFEYYPQFNYFKEILNC